MQEFNKKLSEIEEKYKIRIGEEDINIFNVLFRGYEEVELHSRFISYLLSSNHDFLTLFIRDILKIQEKNFELKNCRVYPNEQDKTEKWEIDILIINKQKKQAIIIENKLNAKDSYHMNGLKCNENGDKSYRGQLERYYNTIATGCYKRGVKYINIDKSFICNKVYVYYLTLYKLPTNETIGELPLHVFDPSKHKIDYYQIQDWLRLCIGQNQNSFLNTIIEQYLALVKRITSDNNKALAVTDLIAQKENWKIAFNNINSFEDVYKDVKWHTIHRFFAELNQRIGGTAIIVPDENSIADIAHFSRISKKLKMVFYRNGAKLQIVNDKKGFTLGNLSNSSWDYFSDKIKNIKLYDFSVEETFHITNKEYRQWVIDKMIQDIDDKYDKLNYSFC